jgi:predicted ATPase
VEVELLYQQGLPPQALYRFKHALIQEVAYQSLLRSTRQQYHQRIAQVLEARFPEMTETQPEVLAHHYAESGLPEQALPYWQRAGERAVQRSAHVEAVIHLRKALELLQTLPATREHTQQALMLYTALGPALIATKGYASPEVEHTYARAHELCEQVEDTAQLPRILLGLFTFYLVRAQYQTAYTLAEQLRSHAQRHQNPGLLAEAHWALGNVWYWRSDFVSARAHLEQGMAQYQTQSPCPRALQRGADAGVGCLSYLSRVLWILGYPSQALQSIQAALTLAQAVSHPFSTAFALSNAVALHMLRGEVEATQDYADQLTLLSREQGFTQWVATGMLRAGWAMLTQGHAAEGIAQMQQGLTNWRATGAEMAQPFFLAQLAEAYGHVGQIDKGLDILAEALAIVDKTGECWCEAELYRLQGTLLLTRSGEPHAEAEVCLQQALAVARQQQAKSWELRAARSLARLWQSQGKGPEAYELLAPVYGWFTEGFDTADLQEAKTLLEELEG